MYPNTGISRSPTRFYENMHQYSQPSDKNKYMTLAIHTAHNYITIYQLIITYSVKMSIYLSFNYTRFSHLKAKAHNDQKQGLL